MDYREKIDYSSLDTYHSCKRKFFFKYILHLKPTGAPSVDLIFGSCWHYGHEVVAKLIQSDPSLVSSPEATTEIAVAAFKKLWNLEAKPFFDSDSTYPKSPGRAADMYYDYFSKFLQDDRKVTILGVESPFRVSLGHGFPDYIGRLDRVDLESNGILNIHDHKTSKYDNPITFAGFEQSFQVDGYLVAGHMYFDKLPRVTYDLALCQKSRLTSTRYTVTRARTAIDRFIYNLASTSVEIIEQLDRLDEILRIGACDHRNDVLPIFQPSPGYACTKFFRKCEYFDICLYRNNPLTYHFKTPAGYLVEEWDPETHEENLKSKLQETTT